MNRGELIVPGASDELSVALFDPKFDLVGRAVANRD